jgi:hypothetical protein
MTMSFHRAGLDHNHASLCDANRYSRRILKEENPQNRIRHLDRLGLLLKVLGGLADGICPV